MNVDERVNMATLTVDLNSPASVREALLYLVENATKGSADYLLLTSKVRVIKVVRAFGEKVAESVSVDGLGEITHSERGLRSAKYFVDSNLNELDTKNGLL